jgi:small subunit ribosomal protein S2
MAQSELMRQLIEAGAHFGHQTHRWNPKMGRYIFGERSNIHIIDLSQTLPLLDAALQKVREVASGGGRILFVGTKRQASEPIAAAAQRCAQYYMNQRWLGGTLTNWNTISNSIKRLRELTEITSTDGPTGLTKKELLNRTREREKLERSLGGIAGMGGVPDLMFVIDTNKEAIAIQEALKLGIPVVAIVDTNCDPDLIDFPIPGNDDAARAIQMYCDMIADSVLEGMEQGQVTAGVDIGASDAPTEPTQRRRGRNGQGAPTAPEAAAPAEPAPTETPAEA